MIVLLRDVLLLLGYKVLVPRGYDFEVNTLGKIATWLLYAAIALLLVTQEGTAWPSGCSGPASSSPLPQPRSTRSRRGGRWGT